MNHSYGLFKALKNIHPLASTIFIVGCGPSSDSHEIDWFLKHYPGSAIYGFEACPANFAGLIKVYGQNKRVHLFSLAVADFDGMAKFNINRPVGAHSLLNWNIKSRVKPASWTTAKVIDIVATKLDSFCESNHIDSIDILFMDTQGAEHLVLGGAWSLVQQQKIKVVIGEAIFTDIYGYEHSFVDSYNQLARTGLYDFWGFYRPVYSDAGRLHHCDFMFKVKE